MSDEAPRYGGEDRVVARVWEHWKASSSLAGSGNDVVSIVLEQFVGVAGLRGRAPTGEPDAARPHEYARDALPEREHQGCPPSLRGDHRGPRRPGAVRPRLHERQGPEGPHKLKFSFRERPMFDGFWGGRPRFVSAR